MQCIKQGSSNSDVGVMQRCLKSKGFYTGVVDDSFGPYSNYALKAYQRTRGLVVDGYCCTKTWAALTKDCPTNASPKPVVKGDTVCGCAEPFYKQNTGYTCGVETIQMIAACYGLYPNDATIIKEAGTTQQNGTGHAGMKAAFKDIGFKYAESFYLKDMPWSAIKSKLAAGYQVACNIMTGGLVGWTGDYAHWVVLRCASPTSVKINDPTKGVVTHSIGSFINALNRNGNPDFILVKK